jgi:hypothetical protein
MTSDLQFGIAIPQFVADGAFDPAAFRSHLARAEALGVDSAWDRAGPRVDAVPDPIETMTYAAACSERIRLGCAVFVTPLHSPVQLARSLATLDQLSRGRIDVGVATGGSTSPSPPPPSPSWSGSTACAGFPRWPLPCWGSRPRSPEPRSGGPSSTSRPHPPSSSASPSPSPRSRWAPRGPGRASPTHDRPSSVAHRRRSAGGAIGRARGGPSPRVTNLAGHNNEAVSCESAVTRAASPTRCQRGRPPEPR